MSNECSQTTDRDQLAGTNWEQPPMTKETTERNEWRETVRDLYDRLHSGYPGVFSGNKLAIEIVAFIESRHADYFGAQVCPNCQGQKMAWQWRNYGDQQYHGEYFERCDRCYGKGVVKSDG